MEIHRKTVIKMSRSANHSFGSFRQFCPISSHKSGVALIIVLAFVVLLTGLVVAYFSRALSDRQVSTSSANQTKVQLFTQGAVVAIIDDLKQEVAAGSTITAPSPAPQSGSVYAPSSPQTAVPARVLTANELADSSLNNLVKQSLCIGGSSQPFFTGTNYNSTAYPPSARAANVASDSPSLNGRSVSAARWNKPLFLEATSPANLKPKSAQFQVPYWILVTRNGNNISGSSLPATAISRGSKYTGTASIDGGVVVGRYAYNIYDEGELLDANVAGYPSTSTSSHTKYKPASSYADLSQIFAANGTKYADQIVGWRNYTSAQPAGALPGFTFSGNGPGSGEDNYYNFVIGNTIGFLRTGNTALSSNGQSDHLFTSREQLISFLTSLSSTGDAQNALQYLTTFSRDLNQPSYVPANGIGGPKVLTIGSGGNFELGDPAGKPGPGKDSLVNPSLLTVRVLTTKTGGRNNGADLLQGEPLIKKRFSLRRLAWLTYKGPSKGKTGADIDDLKNNFGFTQAFLDQGIDNGDANDNIEKYFGLKWNAGGFWSYDVHAGGSGIKRLDEVQAENREPDFFELLKATISAGALGKSGSQGGNLPAYGAQFTRDSSIDIQVIQIGANIIDQFDVDGYPTRIQFTPSGLATKEIRGVENLPYLYCTRTSVWVIKNPSPMPANVYNQTQSPQTPIVDPGTAILIQEPEIWNPHNYNSADLNRSLGNPPASLHFYACHGAPALPPATTDTSNVFYVRSKAFDPVTQAYVRYLLHCRERLVPPIPRWIFPMVLISIESPPCWLKPVPTGLGSEAIFQRPAFRQHALQTV
ncbi:MAG: hypothetical protein QM796_14570 [Chthoniobacteraceae bacterium]